MAAKTLAAVSSYVVIRSDLIATRQEAIDYNGARLAGEHDINCHGRRVRIVLPRDGAHLYSEESKASPLPMPQREKIVRRVAGGRVEVRAFSLTRARLLDRVLPAIESYTVSVPGTGANGREKRMLHGPPLGDGRYLRVVLRPGPADAWTCVSAYPVTLDVWRAMVRATRAKFPPE